VAGRLGVTGLARGPGQSFSCASCAGCAGWPVGSDDQLDRM